MSWSECNLCGSWGQAHERVSLSGVLSSQTATLDGNSQGNNDINSNNGSECIPSFAVSRAQCWVLLSDPLIAYKHPVSLYSMSLIFQVRNLVQNKWPHCHCVFKLGLQPEQSLSREVRGGLGPLAFRLPFRSSVLQVEREQILRGPGFILQLYLSFTRGESFKHSVHSFPPV